LVGILGAPTAASAQVVVGPVAGFHDDLDFGLGGYARIPVPSLAAGLSIVPSFVYYFPGDDLDAWEINGDVSYAFQVSEDTPVLPFALAGLNILNVGAEGFDSETEIGLNLGGGITFRAESVEPFVGVKFEIQDGSGFVIFGGVGFPVG
jgi:hypothetical protein